MSAYSAFGTAHSFTIMIFSACGHTFIQLNTSIYLVKRLCCMTGFDFPSLEQGMFVEIPRKNRLYFPRNWKFSESFPRFGQNVAEMTLSLTNLP